MAIELFVRLCAVVSPWFRLFKQALRKFVHRGLAYASLAEVVHEVHQPTEHAIMPVSKSSIRGDKQTMMSILSPTISKGTLQALTELTGEPRLNVALPIALQDAVAHRLEKVNVAIRALEQKYGMSFDQFQTQGEEENIQHQFSYEVESDYLEWDGLISRKMKLERIEQWLA